MNSATDIYAFEKFTVEDSQDLFDALIDNPRRIETYEDAHSQCYALRNFCIACLSVNGEDGYTELDRREERSLLQLTQLLNVCADLFLECDPYFRTK